MNNIEYIYLDNEIKEVERLKVFGNGSLYSTKDKKYFVNTRTSICDMSYTYEGVQKHIKDEYDSQVYKFEFNIQSEENDIANYKKKIEESRDLIRRYKIQIEDVKNIKQEPDTLYSYENFNQLYYVKKYKNYEVFKDVSFCLDGVSSIPKDLFVINDIKQDNVSLDCEEVKSQCISKLDWEINEEERDILDYEGYIYTSEKSKQAYIKKLKRFQEKNKLKL